MPLRELPISYRGFGFRAQSVVDSTQNQLSDRPLGWLFLLEILYIQDSLSRWIPFGADLSKAIESVIFPPDFLQSIVSYDAINGNN